MFHGHSLFISLIIEKLLQCTLPGTGYYSKNNLLQRGLNPLRHHLIVDYFLEQHARSSFITNTVTWHYRCVKECEISWKGTDVRQKNSAKNMTEKRRFFPRQMERIRTSVSSLLHHSYHCLLKSSVAYTELTHVLCFENNAVFLPN